MNAKKPPQSASPDPGACLDERRRNRRISVRLGVAVRLPASAADPATVERTTTRNISPGDMCFESGLGSRLRTGDTVELDIQLPASKAKAIRGLTDGPLATSERRLLVKGRIVRVEAPDSGDGPSAVAVVFERPPAFHNANG